MQILSVFLSLMLLGPAWASKDTSKDTTQIGLSRGDDSWSVKVPLNDCHDVDEDDITFMYTKKRCMVFTGPVCIGQVTQLMPGEHESEIPVDVGSVFCFP